MGSLNMILVYEEAHAQLTLLLLASGEFSMSTAGRGPWRKLS